MKSVDEQSNHESDVDGTKNKNDSTQQQKEEKEVKQASSTTYEAQEENRNSNSVAEGEGQEENRNVSGTSMKMNLGAGYCRKFHDFFPIFIAKILLPKMKNFIFLNEIHCDFCQFQKWDFLKSIFSRFFPGFYFGIFCNIRHSNFHS